MSEDKKKSFGTAPVFFTAISTILGAILFLRFGMAVGTLGFWGVIMILVLGHLVTIPTALALSEIATNKRVEGGGEYFIISRSFGLNIGATIGITLFLSQAISVAFYIIAFTESFEFFFDWFFEKFGTVLPRQVISIPAMLGLSVLIFRKGASVGVKTLYFVVAILFVALLMFFLGKTEYSATNDFSIFNSEIKNMDSFFIVFAIIFPAFTGMTAGVGLSGDLKNPGKSIPLGTIAATFFGLIIYVFVIYKLIISSSTDDLMNKQLIMSDIAIGGRFIIPIGLAASTLSSAIGSIMVAPRTLQALAGDRSFPSKRLNRFLNKSKKESNEPVNATLITIIIALFIVAIGNVNLVAQIISMFFMVTYGSLCLISFLHHFGSSPSYRPSFKSSWIISLIGFVTSIWVMFRIDTMYALSAIIFMVLLYMFVNNYHKGRKGLSSIFTNALFQLNRWLQVYLQNTKKARGDKEWRPSAICISTDSFKRDNAFQLIKWISYKYGFGTYIHLIEGYFSKSTNSQSEQELEKLLKLYGGKGNQVFVDTLISPSYTSAIAQSIQLPGVSGMENNMILFEYDREDPKNLDAIVDNFALVNAGKFDVCIFGSVKREITFKSGIHVWIKSTDTDNSHLMILLSFIIQGHPKWKKSNIVVHEICSSEREEEVREELNNLVKDGRLPITSQNIQIVIKEEDVKPMTLIEKNSASADLTIIGFHSDQLRHDGKKIFEGYNKLGNVLFVNANGQKEIS